MEVISVLCTIVLIPLVIVCVIILSKQGFKIRPKTQEEIKSEEKQARIDREYMDSIVKTVIVDSSHIVVNDGRKTGSAIGRAVVGGAIFGDVGAVVGASTAKNKVTEKHSTTFLVYFTDGTQKAITVDNGSKQYNMYISKLSQ